jgi:chromosomal replication initiation ATPase DnaA
MIQEKQRIVNKVTIRVTRDVSVFRIIEDVVIADLGVTGKELRSKSRRREFVEGRYIMCQMLRNMTSFTFKEIGGEYNIDYSTAICCLKKFATFYESDKVFRSRYERIYDKSRELINKI